MDTLHLEEKIRDHLDEFPAKTRRVAEYILGNSSEIAFHSISETAERLSVSRAQLVRVARMLGFSGYADLKNMLKRKLLAQVIPAAVNNSGDDEDLCLKLSRLEHANLDETYRSIMLNHEAVSDFSNAAQEAEAIYCMGWGISSMPAEWLYTRISELGLKSILIRRGSLSIMEQARSIGENDMLVVFELPSYVIEVTEAVKLAAGRNACVVSITDSPAAPVCGHSRINFYVSDRSPLFGSSLVGSMFAVQVLTSFLARDMGRVGREALQEQKAILNDERIYYPSYYLRY
jgi:DNA-binding MurR/RpiR family transcriptional regulator